MNPITRFLRSHFPMPYRARRIGPLLASGLGAAALALILGLLFYSPLQASPAVAIALRPAEQSVIPGNPANFTVFITNTGSVTLTEITVSNTSVFNCNRFYDPTFPIFNLPDLGPGASTSYDCGSDLLYDDLTNTATVTAVPEGGGSPVSAAASAQVKARHLRIFLSPELQQVGPGQPANFTVTVSNTGGFQLTNIVVTDTLAAACSRPAGTLANLNPGQKHTYACQTGSLMAQLENKIQATASLTGGAPLVDDHTNLVAINSPLVVTLAPERQVVLPGRDGTFTVTLRNTGGGTLTNVAVAAPAAPGCARPAGVLGSLAPGGMQTYSCISPPLNGDLLLDVTATASSGSTPVSAAARGFAAADPPIKIDVSPAFQFVQPGMTATFQITLTNAFPNVDLVNPSVAAPNTPGCGRSQGVLATIPAGGSTTYTCTTQIANQVYLHPMTATASPFDGDPVANRVVVRAGLRQEYLPYVGRFSSAPDRRRSMDERPAP